MKDLFLSYTGALMATALTDINTILAGFCYAGTGFYTAIKIYQHYKNGKADE
jgi:hypothetical protein